MVPGLIQKYCVRFTGTREYGGIYLWDSRESLEAPGLLREQEAVGVIERRRSGHGRTYRLTPAGREFVPTRDGAVRAEMPRANTGFRFGHGHHFFCEGRQEPGEPDSLLSLQDRQEGGRSLGSRLDLRTRRAGRLVR